MAGLVILVLLDGDSSGRSSEACLFRVDLDADAGFVTGLATSSCFAAEVLLARLPYVLVADRRADALGSNKSSSSSFDAAISSESLLTDEAQYLEANFDCFALFVDLTETALADCFGVLLLRREGCGWTMPLDQGASFTHLSKLYSKATQSVSVLVGRCHIIWQIIVLEDTHVA